MEALERNQYRLTDGETLPPLPSAAAAATTNRSTSH